MSVSFLISLDSKKIAEFFIIPNGLLLHDDGVSEDQSPSPVKQVRRNVRIIMDGYCISFLRNLLEVNPAFRMKVLNYWTLLEKQDHVKICVTLIEPQKHIMDLRWAKMIDRQVIERRELDNSFSWMSTLGGAYSALGDYIPNFAVIAGKISVHQLQLAICLGDIPIVIRCCLYYSLSLIQQGKLHDARQVIETQYRKTKQLPIEDGKLVNICKGIWSRLQYEWELHKKKRKVAQIHSQ